MQAITHRHYEELVVESLEQCFKLFRKLWQSGYYFRGHSSAQFGLYTTLDRFGGDLKRERENYLMREFRRRIHHFIGSEDMPGTTLELLSLMQHYGVPTRLLDYTRSPYVALYFAVRDVLNTNDSAVWAIHPQNLNRISIKRLNTRGLPPFPHPLKELTLPELRSIFTEENYFTEAFLSDKYNIIMALEPVKMHARLNIQQGIFLISGKIEEGFAECMSSLLEDIREEMPVNDVRLPTAMKCTVPFELKAEMMRELDSMNINASTLFGGLEGFAQSLREKTPTLGKEEMEHL